MAPMMKPATSGKTLRTQTSPFASHVRTDHEQRDGDSDEQGQERDEDGLDQLGNDPLEPLLDPRLKVDGDDDGDDRRGIGHERDGKPEEANRRARGPQRREGGIAEGSTDSHTYERVTFELLGRSEAKEQRQEVEHAVADGIENLIGRRIRREPAERGAHDAESLDESHRSEGTENGHEDTRDGVEQDVDDASLGGVALVVSVNLASELDVRGGANGIVHVSDVIADYHLVLTSGLDDRDDALGLVDLIGLGLRLVLEHKAQTRHTVSDGADVLLTTDELDDRLRKLLVVPCHRDTSRVGISAMPLSVASGPWPRR